MATKPNVDILIKCGLDAPEAERFVAEISDLAVSLEPTQAWQWITQNLLRPEHPFAVHQYLYRTVFADWDPAMGPAPAWIPERADLSNIAWLMRKVDRQTYRELHEWSVSERAAFWATMIERLDIGFSWDFPYNIVCWLRP